MRVWELFHGAQTTQLKVLRIKNADGNRMANTGSANNTMELN